MAFLSSGIELHDRRLRVLDITAGLDLRQAVLVYLSSCDGAHAVPGHKAELLALTRALLYAGSPSVIGTLWPLRDEVGYAFASHFYRRWLRGHDSLAGALRQATIKIRELYPKPFDWAPFVLMGAWQTRVPVGGLPVSQEKG